MYCGRYHSTTGWPCCRTSFGHLNEKLGKVRRDLDRQALMRTTTGSCFDETPGRFSHRSRPVSAMRISHLDSSPRRSPSPTCYLRPASAGRKYFPRQTTETYDTGALERRRLRVENSLRRYTAEREARSSAFNGEYRGQLFGGLQGDLTDLKNQVNIHLNSLQAKEYALQDELERLGSERHTVRDHPEFTARVVSNNKTTDGFAQRRNSFSNAKTRNLSRERVEQR